MRRPQPAEFLRCAASFRSLRREGSKVSSKRCAGRIVVIRKAGHIGICALRLWILEIGAEVSRLFVSDFCDRTPGDAGLAAAVRACVVAPVTILLGDQVALHLRRTSREFSSRMDGAKSLILLDETKLYHPVWDLRFFLVSKRPVP